MKKVILFILIIFLFQTSTFVYSFPENEADFLYNHKNHDTPIILNYSNGHTYTRGLNDTYIRDDGVQFYKHPKTDFVETSDGKMYMPINNTTNPDNTYYVRTR